MKNYNVSDEPVTKVAVDSVLQQTLKDIEVIVVNDGSNDQSLVECYRLQEIDDLSRGCRGCKGQLQEDAGEWLL